MIGGVVALSFGTATTLVLGWHNLSSAMSLNTPGEWADNIDVDDALVESNQGAR